MKPCHLYRTFLLALTLLPGTMKAQENLANHLYWKAQGTHDNQSLGVSGLDTIGFVNDTIRHAFALGSDGGSSYVFNRGTLDTLRRYKFPGQKVIRCSMNGDAWPDFVCWDRGKQRITVLFGTDKVDSFATALTLQETQDYYRYLDESLVVADCDSDGYDDMIIVEPQFRDSTNHYIGKVDYYRGGKTLSESPSQEVIGDIRTYVGGSCTVGRVHGGGQQFLIEFRGYALVGTSDADTVRAFLFPLGDKFSLRSYEQVVFSLDTAKQCCFLSPFRSFDYDGDGVDDLLMVASDKVPVADKTPGYSVFAYKGGDTIATSPSFIFHRPFITNSGDFGTRIVDMGDATGRGYHTLAISDPSASFDGLNNGAVFLYNMGKALKDSCVAYASGPEGFEDHFGAQMIAPGDVSGDGLSDLIVGANEGLSNEGGVFVFLGSPVYGPQVGVQEKRSLPEGIVLGQNYPNPASAVTRITFAATNAQLRGHAVRITVYDVLGRERIIAYDGTAGSSPRTTWINVSALPTGAYRYELACGSFILSRWMNVIK